MKPMLSKFDLICLVEEGNPDFDNNLWLEQVLDDSEGYHFIQESIPLTTEDLNIGQTHTLKFKVADEQQFSEILAISRTNIKYLVYCFGPDGCLFWAEPTKFSVKQNINPKTKTVKTLELSFSVYGIGLKIRSGRNLLDLDDSNGSFPGDGNWELVSGSGTATGNVTPNGGFSTAIGNKVFKNAPITNSGLTVARNAKYPFPVRDGMPFTLRADIFEYGGSGIKTNYLEVKWLDDAGMNVESAQINNAVSGLSVLFGNFYVVEEAGITHFGGLEWQTRSATTPGTCELDNIMLMYGTHSINTPFTES